MGFLDFFKKQKLINAVQKWKEVGGYKSTFTAFGTDIYSSPTVRAAIRPLAEFSSKAEAKCSDKQLERLLNNRPNVYMSGHDFLAKIRTRLELQNTVFIFIQRDDRGKPSGFYPVPYATFEAVEYSKRLFIMFHFNSDINELTLPWEDLAVIRKDYNRSDIAGDDNLAIIETLELLNTTNQGIANAVKATANLRGILKSTKAILSPEDIKKQKERFVKDYLNLENEGGIASLDATQDFTPITMNPVVTSADQIKNYETEIYSYFGVNEKIIQGNMNSDEIEAFYELRIEPFLVALSRELQSKIYNSRELAYEDKNWIVYEANKLQFVSLTKKIQLFKEVVLYGGMTINEWRSGCNMAPLEGGDEPIRRLDAAPVDDNEEDDTNE